jgi:hypothetical protein
MPDLFNRLLDRARQRSYRSALAAKQECISSSKVKKE